MKHAEIKAMVAELAPVINSSQRRQLSRSPIAGRFREHVAAIPARGTWTRKPSSRRPSLAPAQNSQSLPARCLRWLESLKRSIRDSPPLSRMKSRAEG
jgi:hypothetical protein